MRKWLVGGCVTCKISRSELGSEVNPQLTMKREGGARESGEGVHEGRKREK